MATQSYTYDHPQYQVHVPANVNLPAVAASTSAGKYVAFAAQKIKSIRGRVNIAGTADAAVYVLKNGTTAFATCTPGTTAAGGVLTVTMSEQTLAAGGFIEFTTGADSATMAAAFCLEVEPVPGHDVTV